MKSLLSRLSPRFTQNLLPLLRPFPPKRASIVISIEPQIIAYGDAKNAKEAEKTAALHGVLLLAESGLLNAKPTASNALQSANAANNANSGEASAVLGDGTQINAMRAREFMDFYCKKFRFGKPDIVLESGRLESGRPKKGKPVSGGWKATMTVGGKKIGLAEAKSKKEATSSVYIDTVKYLEECDPDLWKFFNTNFKMGAPLGMAPHVYFTLSEELDEDVRDIYAKVRSSLLFAKRPRMAGMIQSGEAAEPQVPTGPKNKRSRWDQTSRNDESLTLKSAELLERLQNYQVDPSVNSLREQRKSLPVSQRAADVLVKIEMNQVTIIMAATGSGKTTQIPQILFDDYITKEEGAKCNIVCTQPRRIAAISVAERVARERGERLGDTIGYQVRFDSKNPRPNGSITFCTTGIFLRKLQSALGDTESNSDYLDSITHVVVDEVHERDVETDLLLVVIKRLLAERKKVGKKEIKLILMSATIDPTLFQTYFSDPISPTKRLAPVVEVPGRSFPVEKHYLEETMADIEQMRLSPRDGGWVFNEENVRKYLDRELRQGGGVVTAADQINGKSNQAPTEGSAIDDLELPYPLISLLIAFVINKSSDGHVLVFLPGFDEIKSVANILSDPNQFPLLGIIFNDPNKFEIHILHSSIPVADQQRVFEDPPVGVRRIILATNIAETSITIPNVVYVVDTGRVKEKRFDPERHLSSLVSAWVGTSNLNQRAGRAGRHRPGEYYGVLSKARYEKLSVHQTVEMMRVDLSNVVSEYMISLLFSIFSSSEFA